MFHSILHNSLYLCHYHITIQAFLDRQYSYAKFIYIHFKSSYIIFGYCACVCVCERVCGGEGRGGEWSGGEGRGGKGGWVGGVGYLDIVKSCLGSL